MKHYGIRLASANVLLDGNIKALSYSDTDIMWFLSDTAALQFCNDYFAQKAETQNAKPEAYEHEKTKLPGIAYMWVEDELLELQQICNGQTDCIGIGNTVKPKNAELVYCPPPNAKITDASQSRQYLYSTDFHKKILSRIAATYLKNAEIRLPDGYQPKIVSPDTYFVHYGSTKFDEKTFTPISSRRHDVKPSYGFWASPLYTRNSWLEWCNRENYANYDINQRMEFSLKPDAKVIQIDSLDDITFLIKNYPIPYNRYMLPYGSYMEHGLPYLGIDYEAMSKDFDGINYNHTELGNILGPWDCDSVVIFNPDVMEFRDIVIYPEDIVQKYLQQDYDDYIPDDDDER